MNITKILEEFGFEMTVKSVTDNGNVARYRFTPPKGRLLRDLVDLEEDIALKLGVENVCIGADYKNSEMVIDIPLKERKFYEFDSAVDRLKASKYDLPIVIGKTLENEIFINDLSNLQGLAVFGSAGSGKTVFLKSIINSIITTKAVGEACFIIAGEKVKEDFNAFKNSLYLQMPFISDVKDFKDALSWLKSEMDRRKKLFVETNTKHISQYNQLQGVEKMPRLVFIIDEYSVYQEALGEEFDMWIKRTLAVCRFMGIHIILSSNKTTTSDVSPVIVANFSAYVETKMYASDENVNFSGSSNAIYLTGCGDLAYYDSNYRIRAQGALC